MFSFNKNPFVTVIPQIRSILHAKDFTTNQISEIYLYKIFIHVRVCKIKKNWMLT